MDRDQEEQSGRSHTSSSHINPEREEVHTGDISDDSIATGQERRTRLCDRFLFFEKNYREEAAAEIANWTVKQGVEDYSDKSLGAVCMDFYFFGALVRRALRCSRVTRERRT